MNYKVLFRIERLKLIDKLKAKIVNYRRYCEEMGDTCEIEIVCAGNVVTHFLEEDEFFKDESLQVKLCKNALNGLKPDYEQKNIQIVSAGIGEIIKRKSASILRCKNKIKTPFLTSTQPHTTTPAPNPHTKLLKNI